MKKLKNLTKQLKMAHDDDTLIINILNNINSIIQELKPEFYSIFID